MFCSFRSISWTERCVAPIACDGGPEIGVILADELAANLVLMSSAAAPAALMLPKESVQEVSAKGVLTQLSLAAVVAVLG